MREANREKESKSSTKELSGAENTYTSHIPFTIPSHPASNSAFLIPVLRVVLRHLTKSASFT